mgnify:CR=1 FL=1
MSIAAVCRRVGINRQQFNKYLAGAVRPSRHNMRRICDFFGVTEALIGERAFGFINFTGSVGGGPQVLE